MTTLPKTYRRFRDAFPAVAAAYDILGATAHEAGPLDEKTRRLVKLAMAIGAQREGAVTAHTHRALQAGVTAQEIEHVVVLALTAVGFSGAAAAYDWVTAAEANAGKPGPA